MSSLLLPLCFLRAQEAFVVCMFGGTGRKTDRTWPSEPLVTMHGSITFNEAAVACLLPWCTVAHGKRHVCNENVEDAVMVWNYGIFHPSSLGRINNSSSSITWYWTINTLPYPTITYCVVLRCIALYCISLQCASCASQVPRQGSEDALRSP